MHAIYCEKVLEHGIYNDASVSPSPIINSPEREEATEEINHQRPSHIQSFHTSMSSAWYGGPNIQPDAGSSAEAIKIYGGLSG